MCGSKIMVYYMHCTRMEKSAISNVVCLLIISKTKINILKNFLQSSLLAPLGLFNSKIFPFFALIC